MAVDAFPSLNPQKLSPLDTVGGNHDSEPCPSGAQVIPAHYLPLPHSKGAL
jgi:hypothetical protein